MSARARKLVIAALACAAVLGAIPVIASAADSTVKGTVAGPGTPDAGEGVTAIRAVNAETGAIGGADYTTGKRDGWSLTVAPGPYAMGATTVPFGGGKLIEKLLAFVEARSGKTETVKLKLKRQRRHHRSAAATPARRVAEGFGDVAVDYPAIWVKEWDIQSTDPEHGVLSKGMAEMLITDLSQGFERTPDCRAVVVERARIGEVISEQTRQQLPGYDPGTRVRQGHLLIDNGTVSGTLTASGGHMTLTATYTDRRNGRRSRTVSVQGPQESFFSLEQQLAQKLLEVICSDGLPEVYGGTISGSSADTETIRSWHGNVTFERIEPPDPRAAQCNGRGVACYELTSSTVTWETSSAPGAECTHQSGPKTVSAPAGTGMLTVDGGGSETPGYSGGFGALDMAPGTQQCGTEPPEDQTYPLTDCCMATNSGTPWGDYGENGGLTLRGTRTTNSGPSYTVTHSWDLSGR
jgi:hypothetical protein